MKMKWNELKKLLNYFFIKDGGELTKLYCKSDVFLLADVFEKFVKVSFEEYGFNPLYCVSLHSYTYQCALKNTDIKLQTLEGKDMILLIENKIRGGISSVMGDRPVKSDENKKILSMDATNLYGHSLSQMLPYNEIQFEKDICLGDLLNTPDDSYIGIFIEVVSRCPDTMKKKTKTFPFCPEKEKIDPEKCNEYSKKLQHKNYTKSKKLLCDGTDKKKYLIHYRVLKFYVRHGMVVEIFQESISLKQSKWLEKYISFNTQKRNRAKNDFEKDFII